VKCATQRIESLFYLVLALELQFVHYEAAGEHANVVQKTDAGTKVVPRWLCIRALWCTFISFIILFIINRHC
jgi:hypothetical protein